MMEGVESREERKRGEGGGKEGEREEGKKVRWEQMRRET